MVHRSKQRRGVALIPLRSGSSRNLWVRKRNFASEGSRDYCKKLCSKTKTWLGFKKTNKLATDLWKIRFLILLIIGRRKMGRVLTITNSSHNLAGVRKKTIGREIVIGPNAIKFVAIAIFAILALVYLTQSTAGANRSVKVGALDDKKTQLEMEKERLSVEQTRLQSLKEIDAGVVKPEQTAVLEPGTTVDHINSPAPVATSN